MKTLLTPLPLTSPPNLIVPAKVCGQQSRGPQDASYAFVAEPMALDPHCVGYGPERLSLRPQSDNFADPAKYRIIRG
jgi:hypothetical protein